MTLSTLTRYPVTIGGETLMVGTANELAVVLDVLQGQYDREVLEQLEPNLADIVDSPLGFSTVLKSLEPADQIFFVRTLGSRLADVLQRARYLRDIMATLSAVEVEQELLETLGRKGLRRLILSGGDLAEILEWVYGECDRRLLELLGLDYLRRMLTDGSDLSQVLTGLDESHQTFLIEQLGWDQVIKLVDNGRDLAYLLRALPASISRELLHHFTRQRLVELIGNAADWEFLCRRLETEEAAYLFALLGVKDHA
ncbi:MAG: hypothetical protein Q7R39_00535 [Dehalococcoidia bacterium]|nr:hypothetical protein [Dehalococcoidia bacterium]